MELVSYFFRMEDSAVAPPQQFLTMCSSPHLRLISVLIMPTWITMPIAASQELAGVAKCEEPILWELLLLLLCAFMVPSGVTMDTRGTIPLQHIQALLGSRYHLSRNGFVQNSPKECLEAGLSKTLPCPCQLAM